MSDVIDVRHGSACHLRRKGDDRHESWGEIGAGLVRIFLDARDDLLEVLTGVATLRSAEDELFRSLRALSGAGWEIQRNSPGALRKVASFLPSNNLLYSYVLFGVIPSLYADRLCMRPSARVTDTAMALDAVVGPALRGLGCELDLTPVSQREFMTTCLTADAVVFTGQPRNADAVAAKLGTDTLMLALGSGPNPIVVGPEAELARACRDIVEARVYNSGQDCLCPDIVFVHESVTKEVVERLEDLLSRVVIGERHSPGVQVAPLVYQDAVAGASEFIDRHRENVVSGGAVDADGFVQPTLVSLPWNPDFHAPELFSPIVTVMEYSSPSDVEAWMASPCESERGMYVSVYGEPALDRERVATSVVTRECTTFDIEDGNRPFGGYGASASSVRRRGTRTARPVLLSAEVRR
ncbi:aldehyde dehydrogenase family protein [Streptomyces sp. Tu102]|uniref:aldehyde dehydrogenase family protein n=1 Tax=Streptomyces sp. Tu102 TaxID=2838019 RepID=UPI0027E3C2BF|nr:aldehyde dehydrogenase family protein [Streptomyces sp. Tu102]